MREIQGQQPIGVLIGAALPGTVRIGQEDADHEPLGQALMLRHLFPSNAGPGLLQQHGHVLEFRRKSLTGTHRIRPLHIGHVKFSVTGISEAPSRPRVETTWEINHEPEYITVD